jgi:phosphotransferase system HPr-like phosphotransfer protein
MDGEKVDMHYTTIIATQDFIARRAANLVDEASKLSCSVWVRKGDNVYSAKSLVGMLQGKLVRGEEFVVCTDGDDEVHRKAVQLFLE